MTPVETASNFVKEVLARLTGDTDQAVALKNQRKANAAIEGQLAALKSRQVNAEDTVTEAQEALGNAKYPTVLIASSESYIAGIKTATEKLNSAQDALDAVNESLKFFGDLKANL